MAQRGGDRIGRPDCVEYFLDTGTAFAGAATVVAPGATPTSYGGATGLTTFALSGVSSGRVWFVVEDASNGASGIRIDLSARRPSRGWTHHVGCRESPNPDERRKPNSVRGDRGISLWRRKLS